MADEQRETGKRRVAGEQRGGWRAGRILTTSHAPVTVFLSIRLVSDSDLPKWSFCVFFSCE